MSNYTSEEIAKAISDMQASGASNADIAAAAVAAGVTASEIATATGVDVGTINQIFQDSGVTPVPEPVSIPAPTVSPATPSPVPTPVAPAPTPAPSSAGSYIAGNGHLMVPDGGQDDNGNPTYNDMGVQQAAATVAPVTPTPTAPAPTPVQNLAAPVAPSTSTIQTADLSQYNSQTQNGIKNAGLDSVMNSVVNGINISDLVKQGLTPQAIGQYKDASGNMLTAAPNTFMVSNPDGSGGALNYFFTVDPTTGTTAPINNPAQNLTYTPGSPGGVISGLISQAGDIIKTVAPIALDTLLIANGIDPVTAGAITGSASAAANGGNLGDILKGGVVGGVSGVAGGAASDAVGAGAPITSGVAGGAAAGATGAALTGQDIVTGAATGGIVGGGAGALGLGDIAQNAVDTNADTADINNALKTFNAANPGASPTAQADFLINDPDLAGFNAKQISTALGTSNPISQAAAVIEQSYALNGQEVVAGQQSSAPVAPVAPTAPAQPTWVQDLADAYNSAQTTHDWTTVDNIIKSNGLTADQIAQTYNITNPSTLSNIQDIVANGAGSDTVNVTGSNTGTFSTSPAETPVTLTGTNLNPITVTAPGDTGVNAPPTPPITGPVIPPVTVTGQTGTNLTEPETPPITGPVIPPVTVTAPKDTGLTVPPTPPVVPPTVTPVTPEVPSVPITPPVVVPPATPTPTPTTPIPPTSSTASVPPIQMSGLVNPGLNPGWLVNGANQNFYNTNNPVQNTYYWGAHPYMMNPGDMSSYNNVPGAPATPFGLQNLQHPIGYDAQGKPIYPTASAPATQAAKGPGTLQQQLGAAWSAGNYGQVNNLVQQNQVTTNQAKSIWGFQPSDFAFAAAHGVNLIQPVAPSSTTTATTAASST